MQEPPPDKVPVAAGDEATPLAGLIALRDVPRLLPMRAGKRICIKTLYRWVFSGRLPAVKIGNSYYITPQALAELARPVELPAPRPRQLSSRQQEAALARQREWTQQVLKKAGLR
jgi:hypothetical protein